MDLDCEAPTAIPQTTVKNQESPPLMVAFVAGTSLTRQEEVEPRLPIVRNGPPGTRVVFADGTRVNLPTDQIVLAEVRDGAAHVGFGGMQFTGIEDNQLVFLRVRDLVPEETLSPERGRRMTLELEMVDSVWVDGKLAWPLHS